MAQTTGDTMAEGLKKILSQLGALHALPDSDPNLLGNVMGTISGYLKQGSEVTGGGQQQLPSPGPQGPQMPGALPSPGLGGTLGGMLNASPGAGPMPGLSLPMTSGDELRRLLTHGGNR